jgi:ABC-type dipeptide/oligopeptide/nickel transport system permease component
MKTFWITLSLLFAIFLTLYISQATGYYDYEQYKKTELTEEKIAQFEQDIKDGKEININNYMSSVQTDYNNKISSAGLKVSSTINKYVKSGINGVLAFFGVLLGN